MNRKTTETIDELLKEINTSPLGDLRLSSRKLLWSTITEGLDNKQKRQRLTKLDRISVEHASSYWVAKFGELESLYEILNTATELSEDSISEEQGLRVRDEFYVSVVEDGEYGDDEYPAMFVGHAAANCIGTAIDIFEYDSNDTRTDKDHDPETYEPTFLIASAFAGSLPNSGNPESRRDFWIWYLTDAVKQAIS